MKQKAEMRRQQIIKAAFEAVADKGYEAVTLQDIAEYADVSKGVSNYYFKNKEDVLAHLLNQITERIYEKEKMAVEKETSAEAMLRAYVNSVFVGPLENERFYKVYLDFLAQATRNERYREINARFYQNCASICKTILHHGQGEGRFTVGDIDDASKTIRSLIDGFMVQWLMTGDHDQHATYKDLCLHAIKAYMTKTAS
ncbi:TetR/AcrR family transcriptional regulator [Alkalihalobacillus sp. CinArs1]|uniref:TetR/AcrR family transcriptional regulator n=1 Tax=Alkalihalobacillus sp. CinArs1 TaxID=2995314 RepID=UPI0022DD4F32|nr:TetR/AcrR family transcriptional regulator [Alkalihalobacillus sp. CinArs1]